jgi:hypothetical protein
METIEEVRAVRLVRAACAALNLAAFEWTIASGLVRCGSDVGELAADGLDSPSSYGAAQEALANSKASYNSREPAQMLANLEGISIGAAFILKDLHRHMDEPVVVRRLRDVGQKFSENRRTIILTSPKIEIPAELRGLVEFLELPLPDRGRLCQIIDEVVVRISRSHTLQRKLDPTGFDAVVESLRGLTEEAAERALSQALVARYAVCPEIATDVLRGQEIFAAALRDVGVHGSEPGLFERRRNGSSKALADSQTWGMGRLGARLRTGTSPRSNHPWRARMREIALRPGGRRRMEPSAGKVRYRGRLRQIHRRNGKTHSQSLRGRGRPCALHPMD